MAGLERPVTHKIVHTITIAPVAPIPIAGYGPQSIAGYGPPAPTNFAIDFWVIEESILSSEIRS
jgi:hypothetical protein